MHLRSLVNAKNLSSKNSNSGFTLPEMLVVVVLIGILASLGISNWLAFVNTCRLNTAQSEIYYAMRQAQRQATKDKLTKQASFRIQNGVVQWAVHQAEVGQFIPDAVKNNGDLWNNLESNTRIYEQENNKGKKETTIRKHTSQQVWRVIFNYQGCPIYEVGDDCTNTSLRTLGQITLYNKNAVNTKRCVYVSTILGAMRTGKDHLKANENEKYCY